MDKKCLPVRVPDLDGKVSLAAPLFGVLVFQGEGDAVVQRIVCVPARADGNIVLRQIVRLLYGGVHGLIQGLGVFVADGGCFAVLHDVRVGRVCGHG